MKFQNCLRDSFNEKLDWHFIEILFGWLPLDLRLIPKYITYKAILGIKRMAKI